MVKTTCMTLAICTVFLTLIPGYYSKPPKSLIFQFFEFAFWRYIASRIFKKLPRSVFLLAKYLQKAKFFLKKGKKEKVIFQVFSRQK
jgi:hypothetical protein